MKSSPWLASLSLALCFAASACLEAEPSDPSDAETEPQDEPALAEQQQAVCSEAYGCILTAIQNNQTWLIDTCIAVLCGHQQQ